MQAFKDRQLGGRPDATRYAPEARAREDESPDPPNVLFAPGTRRCARVPAFTAGTKRLFPGGARDAHPPSPDV
jgi:hypothetical protein